MGESFCIFEQDDNIDRKGHKKFKCQNPFKKQMEFDSFVVIFIIKIIGSMGESERAAAEGPPGSGPQLRRMVHPEPIGSQNLCWSNFKGFTALLTKVTLACAEACLCSSALEAISYLSFCILFLKESPPNSKNMFTLLDPSLTNSGSVPARNLWLNHNADVQWRKVIF